MRTGPVLDYDPSKAGKRRGGSAPPGADDDGEKKPPQKDLLNRLCDGCEFWRSLEGDAYVTLTEKEVKQNHPVRSRFFRNWLTLQFFVTEGSGPSTQAMEECLRVLDAKASLQGEAFQTFRRVGFLGNVIYVDLGDPDWAAIEIDQHGWRIVRQVPIKFLRDRHMRPLPPPEDGCMIEELRPFLNVGNEDDFRMMVAWLVGALRPDGPYPILVLTGEQGSAKSLTSRLLRFLIDPVTAPIRTPPRDEHDLIIAASNNWVLAYDNMSGAPGWLSDALCRLATGGGFGTRRLYSDHEEQVFSARRPMILNGIADLTARPDLAERAIAITLPVIGAGTRRSESEIMRDFDVALPGLLGALCDAISAALRNQSHIKLESPPRMVDFAAWITAAESGLGWAAGDFMRVYDVNRQDAVQAAIDGDPLAQAILQLAEQQGPDGWIGTATELLAALTNLVPDRTRNSRFWPDKPNRLGAMIRRLAPPLRAAGLHIEVGKSGNRFIEIRAKASA